MNPQQRAFSGGWIRGTGRVHFEHLGPGGYTSERAYELVPGRFPANGSAIALRRHAMNPDLQCCTSNLISSRNPDHRV